jgi:hypothetical protein
MKSRRSRQSKKHGGKKHKRSRKSKKDSSSPSKINAKEEAKAMFDALLKMQ